MKKIKKGDEVIVITGKDKGNHGKVSKVLGEGSHVIIEGLNLYKKHVKSNPQMNIEGRIESKEMPIHISNIAIYNHDTGKADKVKFILNSNNEMVRVYKATNNLIDA
jgi:large subunit ribosomal protein L24